MLTHMDEKTERLIVRYLDGEATAEEVRAVEDLVARDAAARQLLEEYRRIDGDSRDALRGALVRPVVAAAAIRPRRGMWLATAAGVMAAAATIGLFVFPAARVEDLLQPGSHAPMADATRAFPTAPGRMERPTLVADEGLSRPEAWQRLTPHRDVVDIQQKWVVVLDPATQRVYLMSLDQCNAASVPVTYEH